MQAGEPDGNRLERRRVVPTRVVAAVLAGALLLWAAWSAVREAYAERLFFSGETDALKRAADFSPRRALYRVGLAELLDRGRGDPFPPLREAARLSARDDSIWIRLGLREEIADHVAAAEVHLLEAARVSRKYDPRWTLANFYYRHGREEEFWQWAREALAVSYGDRTPLFDLCWNLRPDPAFLLERAMPRRRPVLADYARLLIAQGQYGVAAAVLEELVQEAVVEELAVVLEATDRLLDAGEYRAARKVWNALCRARLVPYPPLDELTGPVVTNGQFSGWTLGRGFDWRVAHTAGVVASSRPGAGWRISLSGDQPERCEILSQHLMLEPGRRYRLHYRYRTSPVPAGSPPSATGLVWRLVAKDGQVVAESAWRGTGADTVEFVAPAGESTAVLSLRHERIPGSVRAKGVVELESVTVEGGAP
jgi:hypothetical protein